MDADCRILRADQIIEPAYANFPLAYLTALAALNAQVFMPLYGRIIGLNGYSDLCVLMVHRFSFLMKNNSNCYYNYIFLHFLQ